MAKKKKGAARKKQNQINVFQSIGICIIIGVLGWLIATNTNIIDDFIYSYREQYHLVVHGTSDYCSAIFRYKPFFQSIRGKIYGQDDALNEIEAIFKNQPNLTSLAIIGTTGVGKTHFLNLVRKFYPWQENIYHYVWSSFETSDEEKYEHIKHFISHLSSCGTNLIVIDSLTPNEKQIILKYQQFIERYISRTDVSIKLIIIYVFNILQYNEVLRKESESSQKNLQNLDSIHAITFKKLSYIDVTKCIKQTASDLGVVVSESKIVDIVDTIDIDQVGCKNVHAKFTKAILNLS